MKPNNPFLISGYHSPEFFCDRERETSTILDALYNGRNMTLIAPRRMGKTGLIRHIFYRLKEQESDIAMFYMDIYPTQSLGDFVRLFANTVLGKLDSVPQKALDRIGRFIRSCRPVFTLDELTGMPKVTIDVTPAEEKNTLKEIFDYIGSSERRCYIAIDEFQQITEYPEKGIEALLRSYIQFCQNANFIFAGSKQHVMQEMFASSKKPFYQSTQLLTLDAIDRKEYARFAINHFTQNNIKLPQEIFEEVYDTYSGHTWYVQCLLNRLYSYNCDVDRKWVTYAAEQIISEQSYSYVDLLKAYSAGNIRLLKAIAREGCVKEVLSGDFISRHKLRAASSVSSSLKKLLDNELVYQTDKGYIIYDRFMGEWLRCQPF
ncbi:MAG: ATP-binding protein [Porphyromonadaceae bacterium]|nr:ATP-binding protein [Porphyromonadaceae bacterium]